MLFLKCVFCCSSSFFISVVVYFFVFHVCMGMVRVTLLLRWLRFGPQPPLWTVRTAAHVKTPLPILDYIKKVISDRVLDSESFVSISIKGNWCNTTQASHQVFTEICGRNRRSNHWPGCGPLESPLDVPVDIHYVRCWEYKEYSTRLIIPF